MEEREPLLSTHIERQNGEAIATVGHRAVIDFDPRGDNENPQEWGATFKWSIVALLAFMAFTVTFNCMAVVPVATRIVGDLSDGDSSKSERALLVTIWELGEAGGPLLIAPLSEIFGRWPVINICNVFFIGATVLAALSESVSPFIAARALTGLFVTANVLNPAVVGDIFPPESRGSPMSIIMFAPLLGGAIGPTISGAISETFGWRAMLWLCAILAGVCQLFFLTCFRETYKVPILKRRAKRLRKQSPESGLSIDAASKEKGLKQLRNSVLRPASVLGSSVVLALMSVLAAVNFAHFYMMSVTLPEILEDVYGLSPAYTGMSLFTFSVGSAISVFICHLSLDRIYIKLRDAHGGVGQPEYRLPLVIVGSITLPMVDVLYGWVPQLRLPLPVMLLTVVLMGTTLMLAFLPISAYVVDAFGLFAASGMTAVIVLRCLMSTFFPLVAAPLVDEFGYGWGYTLFGAVSICLAPIPILVMKFGPRWRQWSKYTKSERSEVPRH